SPAISSSKYRAVADETSMHGVWVLHAFRALVRVRGPRSRQAATKACLLEDSSEVDDILADRIRREHLVHPPGRERGAGHIVDGAGSEGLREGGPPDGLDVADPFGAVAPHPREDHPGEPVAAAPLERHHGDVDRGPDILHL